MRITDLVSPDAVAVGVNACCRKQVLRAVAGRLAISAGVGEARILKALVVRENLGSTALEGGLAVPHARIGGLDRVRGTFIQLAQPVDFEADDDRQVDLVCAIIAPDGAGPQPLLALAGVCRALHDPAIVKRLRRAGDADEFYAALMQTA